MDILVILDRSGSMMSARSDHEGGLRSFLEDQRGLDGDVLFTLVQFDSNEPFDVVYDRVPIRDVKEITLIPRGGTPLLQAVGESVAHLQSKQQSSPSDSTVCMIITDGHENASSPEWTRSRVQAAVKDREAAGWTFLFLGADIDAFAESAAIGGSGAAYAMSFSHTVTGSTTAAYAATSHNLMRSRASAAGASAGSQGFADRIKAGMSYTDAQRSAVSSGSVSSILLLDDEAPNT